MCLLLVLGFDSLCCIDFEFVCLFVVFDCLRAGLFVGCGYVVLLAFCVDVLC